jgi:hypothetical protein
MGSLALSQLAGCAIVKSAHVKPEISAKEAKLGGTPKDTLDYFDEKYAPGFWKSGSSGARVAVGPVCLSEEAAILWNADEPDRIGVEAESGTSRALVAVQRGGEDIAFYIARASQEVQSIIKQHLTAASSFSVFALSEKAAREVLASLTPYEAMFKDGIRYYVDGTATASDDSDQPARVYLRLTDTATREIKVAASGDGADLATAAQNAVVALVEGTY